MSTARSSHRSPIVVSANIALLLPRVGFHLAGMTASGLISWVAGRPPVR